MSAQEIVLRIDGQPRGKGRPRFNTKTGHAHTDKNTRTHEARVHDAWVNAGRPRIDGPVQLLISVVLERPMSHYRADGSLSAAGQRSPWPTKRPDFDNIAKLVADALNRCAYHDDASVVHHWSVKRWANANEREHTEVVLRPMPACGPLREAA